MLKLLYGLTVGTFSVGPSAIATFDWITMGTHLKQTLNEQYRTITFITTEGSYIALDATIFKIGTFPSELPPNNTLERLTDKISMPIALLNLRNKNNLPDYGNLLIFVLLELNLPNTRQFYRQIERLNPNHQTQDI